jgi:small conductance mechanosensitive channel
MLNLPTCILATVATPLDAQTFLNSFLQTVRDEGTAWFWRGVAVVAILVVGHWLTHVLVRYTERTLSRTTLDPTLRKFFCRALHAFMLLTVVLAVLNIVGVQTASLVAVIGTIGLAIGLALQGALSNFAAGVLLILLRPFKVDDYIEVGDIAGTVEEIGIFTTNLRTADNRAILVPNSTFTGQTVTNVSAKPTRRVDLVIGVSYDDDLARAKAVIRETLAADARVLADPAPVVVVGELGDSSVNILARPWVKSGDYWGVRWDMLEKIKVALEAAGCSIPFPQRDVHIHQHNDNAA